MSKIVRYCSTSIKHDDSVDGCIIPNNSPFTRHSWQVECVAVSLHPQKWMTISRCPPIS